MSSSPRVAIGPAVPKAALALLLAFFGATALAAGTARAATGSAAASAAAWDRLPAAALRGAAPVRPLVDPDHAAALALDQAALARVLSAAPEERRRGRTVTVPGAGLTISIPAPDGGFERFDMVDSPIMEPGLAAEHPDIKTYAGRGVDDPTATVRLDLTPSGFHASVRSDDGAWYVDPRYADLSQYVSYRRPALSPDPYEAFVERDAPEVAAARGAGATASREAPGTPVTLRVYRLALVSDPSYATNTPGTTTAAKVTLMNRVDQLYEQELAIRMELVAGNDQLNLDTAAQATGAGGPCGAAACFTSGLLTKCLLTTLDRNNAVAARVLGAGSYDIAHLVLGTTGGGIAWLGVVGQSGKGRGCTGITQPVGDAFAIDYVAHEMGHQFAGEHTFNGNTNGASNCGPGNRAFAQAVRVEPGSGTSVMGYAGICGQDNLQAHSDPYFSQASITELWSYVNGTDLPQTAVQQAALDDFDGTNSFAITYNGQTSATITNGTNYTASGIKAAIQGIVGWPIGATVTVTGANGDATLDATGFTVTFGGTLAASPASPLGLTSLSGASGFFAAVATGGTLTTRGGAASTTDNHAPGVSVVGGPYTIPARTPFLLDATGSDVDGDPLTYLWEENDPGGASGIPLVDNNKTNGPLFRMFGTAARYTDPTAPGQSPSPGENAATGQTWRSFPDVAQILVDNTNAATGTCPTAGPAPVAEAIVDCYSEFLPTSAWVGVAGNRTLHFRVTARDGHPAYGGLATADTTLAVAAGAGPFRVTSQASAATIASPSSLPVTWDVAGTTGNGVGVADVKISLSLDGGQTFSKVLIAATPNDGSETVALPRAATTAGRIKVEAVGNVFYDVSKADLTITNPSAVIVSGPAGADLGDPFVGTTGAPVTVRIANDGSAPAAIGVATVTGTDAAAVTTTADGCSSTSLPATASCSITLTLSPSHEGTQSASLVVPSDDPASPVVVALTGRSLKLTGDPGPPDAGGGGSTPPSGGSAPPAARPTDAQRAATLAGTLLGTRTPVLLGTAGHLRLFAATKSSRLGRPRAAKVIGAVVCTGGACSGKATAKLALTPKQGKRKRFYAITVAKALKLRDGQGARLTLRLSATNRRRVRAAKKATVRLTVTDGRAKVAKTFALTT